MEYIVYDMFWVLPTNVEVFDQNDEQTRQVTLITCSNDLSERLIVRLMEIGDF